LTNFFLKWEGHIRDYFSVLPLLPKRRRSVRWLCCLYMSPFKLSDQLIDATVYISIMQPDNNGRNNMVEMRTCRWEWQYGLQWYIIMDFVKIYNFRRSARYVSLGLTAVGNEPLKLGTLIVVKNIVMNIAANELRLHYCLQISTNKAAALNCMVMYTNLMLTYFVLGNTLFQKVCCCWWWWQW
jgi:hypothetical protein